MLQRSDEGQADGVPALGNVRRVDVGVGKRRHPGRLRMERPEQGVVGGRGGPHLHRPGSALDLSAHVDADVGGDAVQPRAQARAPLESTRTPQGLDHDLLHGILGLEARAEHPVAVPAQLPSVGLQIGGREERRNGHVPRRYQRCRGIDLDQCHGGETGSAPENHRSDPMRQPLPLPFMGFGASPGEAPTIRS